MERNVWCNNRNSLVSSRRCFRKCSRRIIDSSFLAVILDQKSLLMFLSWWCFLILFIRVLLFCDDESIERCSWMSILLDSSRCFSWWQWWRLMISLWCWFSHDINFNDGNWTFREKRTLLSQFMTRRGCPFMRGCPLSLKKSFWTERLHECLKTPQPTFLSSLHVTHSCEKSRHWILIKNLLDQIWELRSRFEDSTESCCQVFQEKQF